ncbi:hypothetical protein N7445_007119 [Penicillium cf. griseofulvum]|nr:hypothetical protein N7445_007119 [Penicillium cf. griseofulvum]
MAVVAGCFAGAGYFFWRRPASKSKDPEGIPLEDVTVGEQPKEIREEIPEGDYVQAPPPVETPETPETPQTPAGGVVQAPPPARTRAPSTPPKKMRVTSAKLASYGTTARNTSHGFKEVFGFPPPGGLAGPAC